MKKLELQYGMRVLGGPMFRGAAANRHARVQLGRTVVS